MTGVSRPGLRRGHGAGSAEGVRGYGVIRRPSLEGDGWVSERWLVGQQEGSQGLGGHREEVSAGRDCVPG